MKMSEVLRSPMVKAMKAGAKPNEICRKTQGTLMRTEREGNGRCERTRSARLSSSCPSMLLSFLHLATLPSIRSNIAPAMGNTSPILFIVHISLIRVSRHHDPLRRLKATRAKHSPKVMPLTGQEVLSAIEDGQTTAHAIHDGDTVCRSEIADQGKVTRVVDAVGNESQVSQPILASTDRSTAHNRLNCFASPFGW